MVKLISNLGRIFIVTISSPVKVQDAEDEDMTTFLLKSVVVVMLVGV